MDTLLICLVGEQPVANLLPIRHCQPRRIVLVRSTTTRRVSNNLEQLLQGQCEVIGHEVAAFDILAAQQSLADRLDQEDLKDANLLFNLTGGTKPMSLAAFRLAQQHRAPVIYLQSEGGQSLLYSYKFDKDHLVAGESIRIKESLTIEDYLKAHGFFNDVPRNTPPEAFEQVVLDALRPHLAEVIAGQSLGPNLEIDLMLRCQNQFGIAEVKAGKKAERIDGIHQLNTASQRDYLGTYTKRFLIVDRPVGSNNRKLAEAHNIIVVELSSYSQTGELSSLDTGQLVATITEALGSKA